MSSETYQREQTDRVCRLMKCLTKRNQTIVVVTDYLIDFDLSLINQEMSFAGLFVTPTYDSKNAILNIPYQILNANGSQSKETTLWMSHQICKILKTDYAVAISHNQLDGLWWIAVVDSSGKEKVKSVDFQSQVTGYEVVNAVLTIAEPFILK